MKQPEDSSSEESESEKPQDGSGSDGFESDGFESGSESDTDLDNMLDKYAKSPENMIEYMTKTLKKISETIYTSDKIPIILELYTTFIKIQKESPGLNKQLLETPTFINTMINKLVDFSQIQWCDTILGEMKRIREEKFQLVQF